MSNETQVKQEDRELIEAIAEPWICVESPPCEETESVHWEELLTSLTAALATIRKEARGEAFKDAAQIAMGVGDKAYHDRQFAAAPNNRYAQEQIIRQDTADTIAEAITAAAKEGNDGPDQSR